MNVWISNISRNYAIIKSSYQIQKRRGLENIIGKSYNAQSGVLDFNLLQKAFNRAANTGLFGEYSPVSESLDNCDHSWKQYQGFTENYEYCIKCDLKK